MAQNLAASSMPRSHREVPSRIYFVILVAILNSSMVETKGFSPFNMISETSKGAGGVLLPSGRPPANQSVLSQDQHLFRVPTHHQGLSK